MRLSKRKSSNKKTLCIFCVNKTYHVLDMIGLLLGPCCVMIVKMCVYVVGYVGNGDVKGSGETSQSVRQRVSMWTVSMHRFLSLVNVLSCDQNSSPRI